LQILTWITQIKKVFLQKKLEFAGILNSDKLFEDVFLFRVDKAEWRRVREWALYVSSSGNSRTSWGQFVPTGQRPTQTHLSSSSARLRFAWTDGWKEAPKLRIPTSIGTLLCCSFFFILNLKVFISINADFYNSENNVSLSWSFKCSKFFKSM
jgi:hypothetical protein